ncbi:MAG: hypothetical protein HQL96_16510 [Magnetococcales bacterium]|nr:hypothetical protein [Magnetococcales bacterium]
MRWRAFPILVGALLSWPGATGWCGDAWGAWTARGRLFTTPAVRETLNQQRQVRESGAGEVRKTGEPASGGEAAAGAASGEPVSLGPRYYTLDGLVLAGAGGGAAWLNGQRIDLATGFDGDYFRVAPGQDAASGLGMVVKDLAERFRLLPGQTLDAEERQIRPSHAIPAGERRTAMRHAPGTAGAGAGEVADANKR